MAWKENRKVWLMGVGGALGDRFRKVSLRAYYGWPFFALRNLNGSFLGEIKIHFENRKSCLTSTFGNACARFPLLSILL